MLWGVYKPTLKIQNPTGGIPGRDASFFPLMTIEDWPAWYTLLVAAQPKRGPKGFKFNSGSATWILLLDMILAHKDNDYMIEHIAPKVPL